MFKLEVTDFYYIVTVGKKSWYWIRETGKFDGTSWDLEDTVANLKLRGN